MDLRDKDTSGEATSNKVNKDKELNTLKVATLLTSKSINTVSGDSITFKRVLGDSTTSKIKTGGEASTPNKPYTASGCKQYYSKLKKAITPDLEMVDDRGSPPGEPLGNTTIVTNRIDITAKLIREAFLTGFILIDTD